MLPGVGFGFAPLLFGLPAVHLCRSAVDIGGDFLYVGGVGELSNGFVFHVGDPVMKVRRFFHALSR